MRVPVATTWSRLLLFSSVTVVASSAAASPAIGDGVPAGLRIAACGSGTSFGTTRAIGAAVVIAGGGGGGGGGGASTMPASAAAAAGAASAASALLSDSTIAAG